MRPGSPSQIILIRHARSAHVQSGWMDGAAFTRWRASYEAAGIVENETAPPDLMRDAEAAGAIASSDAPRAHASARLLAPRRKVLVTPLLRELDLLPPPLGPLRLPLLAWAVSIGLRSLYRRVAGLPAFSEEEHSRLLSAAAWLEMLCDAEGSVTAVTHASVRKQLAAELQRRGWIVAERRGRLHHWSAWILSRSL